MANSFITSSIVLAEALDLFKNNLRMGNLVYKDYAKEFKGTPKIGESFQIRNPWRFDVQDGPTINLVDMAESTLTMSITAHKVVPISISVRDKTMKVDEFKKKYLEDAMIKLANQVDMDLMGLYTDVAQNVGTAGTTPASYAVFGDAAAKLDLMACPPGNRAVVLNPVATYSMTDALKGLFMNQGTIEGLIKQGKLIDLAGLGGAYTAQNVKSHTAGTFDANYLTNDATPQTGASLVVDTGTGTLKKGDVFTIADVYALNPVNYQSTGQLRQFTVTADYAGGAGTISIDPAIVISGPTRNCSNGAANNKALVIKASHVANLAFHQSAFALATVPFELPETAPVKEQLSADGVVMTLTGGWDITNYREIYRLDILYGVKTIRPEWAVRILG